QAFCDRYWSGRDPIGSSVTVYGRPFTVVGVARDAKYRLLYEAVAPIVFLPVSQRYQDEVTLHVRVAGDPSALASAVRAAIAGLNPDLPVFSVTPLKASMQLGSVFERLAATLAGGFGLLALVLAAVGTSGVVALSTRQRTHEIGVR